MMICVERAAQKIGLMPDRPPERVPMATKAVGREEEDVAARPTKKRINLRISREAKGPNAVKTSMFGWVSPMMNWML